MTFAIFRKGQLVRLQEAASAIQAVQRHTYKAKVIGTPSGAEFSARPATKKDRRLVCPGCFYNTAYERATRCQMCGESRAAAVAGARRRSRRSRSVKKALLGREKILLLPIG